MGKTKGLAKKKTKRLKKKTKRFTRMNFGKLNPVHPKKLVKKRKNQLIDRATISSTAKDKQHRTGKCHPLEGLWFPGYGIVWRSHPSQDHFQHQSVTDSRVYNRTAKGIIPTVTLTRNHKFWNARPIRYGPGTPLCPDLTNTTASQIKPVK